MIQGASPIMFINETHRTRTLPSAERQPHKSGRPRQVPSAIDQIQVSGRVGLTLGSPDDDNSALNAG